MNGNISLLSTLILASMPFWTWTSVLADELVVKEAATLDFHCHLHFPPIHRGDLYWDHDGYDETANSMLDFYGSCDHEAATGEEFSRIVSKNNVPKD